MTLRRLARVGTCVMALTAAGASGASTDGASAASAPSVVFVIPVDSPGQVPKALALAASLRERGGGLADAPIRIYAPARLVTALDADPGHVPRPGLSVRAVTPPRQALQYVLGTKPFAMALAEAEAAAGRFDLMVVLAPNTLVLRPPTVFLLPRGTTLNRELVAAGLAWQRSSWLSRHPKLAAAEEQARRARRGLWRDPSPVPPWEFLGDKSWKDRK